MKNNATNAIGMKVFNRRLLVNIIRKRPVSRAELARTSGLTQAAGIIINENVYRGVGGFGSEVGHISIDINGKMCTCGNRGVLRIYN